jgi:hypothetical protein
MNAEDSVNSFKPYRDELNSVHILYVNKEAVKCLRLLVAGFLARSPGLAP